MIEYLRGSLTELSPTNAIIECNGVGYNICITLTTYDSLRESTGQETKLYIYEIIREDALILYGFTSRLERTMFACLVGVSGVGPATARLILSAMKPERLQACIETGDDMALKAVKGVGAKTAQRIIIDLKGKIDGSAISDIAFYSGSQCFDDALRALVTLGFSQQQSSKALKHLLASEPGMTAEQAIKKALKLL